MVFELYLKDAAGQPLALKSLTMNDRNNGASFTGYSDGNGYVNIFDQGYFHQGHLIVLESNGNSITANSVPDPRGPFYYVPTGAPSQTLTLTLTPFKKPVVPIDRPPLPAFPQPINYRTEMPWTPPVIPTRDFYRGDAWGVVMPGAPVVPGASSKHPERILSWFIDRYTPDFQQEYLRIYAGYGYTHFTLSYADSCGPVDNGPNSPPGNGQTLEQFIATCLRVRSVIPYTHVMIGSKYFQPWNMSAQQWADFADPIMDALFAADAADEIVLGWEWNLWNTPGQPTIDAFKHAGRRCHQAGRSFWMHFSPHVTSWFADGDPRGRFGFYDDIAPDVNGLDYQTQGPNWSPQMLQARIVDSLWQFGERNNDVKFRLWEDYAAWMWDNDVVAVNVDDVPPPQNVPVDPDHANLRGYIGCCTIDNVKHTDAKVWGFGNGGRLPDGSRL